MTLVGINYRTDPANSGYKHHASVIERFKAFSCKKKNEDEPKVV